MITYRWLTPEEVESQRDIFEAYGGALPNPMLSATYGAINDAGEIVGWHVCQLIPHLEPQYVKPDYRAKVSWREFQAGLETLFDKASGGCYFVLPDTERGAKLCKRGGMEEMKNMRVFRKQINKEEIG